MHRAILFDFNGVIVNDEPQHCDALVATLAEYGIPLARESYYNDFLGFDDRECFRFAFERRGLRADDDALAVAIERKAALYDAAIRDSMVLVPGSAEFVRRSAEEGYHLAVVSGALRREIELVLTLVGLRDAFGVIIAAEDVNACKPDPEGYQKAQHAIGVSKGQCVVIEDSLPGLAAARAAGLRCAMIATSHPASDLRSGDVVWDDLDGRAPADLPWLA